MRRSRSAVPPLPLASPAAACQRQSSAVFQHVCCALTCRLLGRRAATVAAAWLLGCRCSSLPSPSSTPQKACALPQIEAIQSGTTKHQTKLKYDQTILIE